MADGTTGSTEKSMSSVPGARLGAAPIGGPWPCPSSTEESSWESGARLGAAPFGGPWPCPSSTDESSRKLDELERSRLSAISKTKKCCSHFPINGEAVNLQMRDFVCSS